MSEGSSLKVDALVLDGAQRAALVIARSLGRRGLRVAVGAAHERALAAVSRYCVASFHYPDPAEDPEACRALILEQVEALQPRLIYPVTDWTLTLLADEDLPLAAAPIEALRTTWSKSATTQLAKACGVPVPASQRFEEPGRIEIEGPLVMKVDTSKTWAGGAGTHHETVHLPDAESAARWLTPMLASGPVQMQASVPGEGVGLAVYAQGGVLQAAFQYRRLHEVPLSGGGSSWRISEALDPVLVGDAERMLKALRWEGVAMLEYKRSGAQRWLIEINGRFWGSLALPDAAGVDFPWMAWQGAALGEAVSQPDYRVGVRARALLRDLEWVKQAVRHGLPKAQLLRDCLSALSPRERWDAFDRRDPRPGLTTLLQIGGEIGAVGRRALEHRRWWAAEAALRASPQQLRGRRRVLFVCEGNIMRSVAAEVLLRDLASADVEAASAGLSARPGGPADPRMAAAAAAAGHDFGAHRAQRPDAHNMGWADLVFAMTFDQLARLKRAHPRDSAKVHLLGALRPEGELEVPDPVHGTRGEVRECFHSLEICVHRLLENL